MKISSSKGFTLMELLVAVFIVGIALAGIMFAVNQSQRYVEQTKRKTIASNLAKEGIEGVYHIRNTNRSLYPATPNECWLKKHPLTSGPKDGCVNDDWMQKGEYIITYAFTGDSFTGDSLYAYLSGGDIPGLDLSDDIQASDLPYSICYTNKTFRSCAEDTSTQNIKFFRVIEGKGLYSKESQNPGGDELSCPNGATPSCGDTSAKEYRFCSRVEYIGSQEGKVEFCGVLTNFK